MSTEKHYRGIINKYKEYLKNASDEEIIKAAKSLAGTLKLELPFKQ